MRFEWGNIGRDVASIVQIQREARKKSNQKQQQAKRARKEETQNGGPDQQSQQTFGNSAEGPIIMTHPPTPYEQQQHPIPHIMATDVPVTISQQPVQQVLVTHE
jgi:hypothetical protein